MSKKINNWASFFLGFGSILAIYPAISQEKTNKGDHFYWAKQSWVTAGEHLNKALNSEAADAEETK